MNQPVRTGKSRLAVYVGAVLLLCAVRAFGQQLPERRIYRLSLPARNWSLDISLSRFTAIAEELTPTTGTYDLSAGMMPEKRSASLHVVDLMVRMAPAQVRGDATKLRESAMKRIIKKDLDGGSLKALEYKDIPLVRYTFDFSGTGLAALNSSMPPTKVLEAYFAKDDTWITIHFSASPFNKDDEKLFYSLLDSVKISDTSVMSSGFDYFQKGRGDFLRKQFHEAIEPLEMALKLEKQQPQLEKTEWRKLILYLTYSYGSIGDKERYKKLLDYGLGQDPNYYRFHYCLAQWYSAENNLEEAIASLGRAFLNQKNEPLAVRIAEPLNDPLSDPAFALFNKIDRFRQAVTSMRK